MVPEYPVNLCVGLPWVAISFNVNAKALRTVELIWLWISELWVFDKSSWCQILQCIWVPKKDEFLSGKWEIWLHHVHGHGPFTGEILQNLRRLVGRVSGIHMGHYGSMNFNFQLDLHRNVMLRYWTFSCMRAPTSCYNTEGSLACACTCHATLLDFLLHLRTYVMLRYWMFSCICIPTSCYATGRYLAFAHTHTSCYTTPENNHHKLKRIVFSCYKRGHAKIVLCNFYPTLPFRVASVRILLLDSWWKCFKDDMNVYETIRPSIITGPSSWLSG
jgi:hypothetical protein